MFKNCNLHSKERKNASINRRTDEFKLILTSVHIVEIRTNDGFPLTIHSNKEIIFAKYFESL